MGFSTDVQTDEEKPADSTDDKPGAKEVNITSHTLLEPTLVSEQPGSILPQANILDKVNKKDEASLNDMEPNNTTNGGQDSKEPPDTMANETVNMEADPLKGPNTIETEQAVKINAIVPTIESITDATANDDLVSNESKPVPQDAVVLEAVIRQESP